MTTEAGKRLLKSLQMSPCATKWDAEEIAAIEAEAVAAERARIKAAMEWLEVRSASDDERPGIYWDGWLAALTAVLRIVDPEIPT